MTNVDTKKLQELIDEHKRYQKIIENEQAVINNAGNLLSRVRKKYTEGYVISAVNTASLYVDRTKKSSATLKEHLNKKKTGIQKTLEIYLEAEKDAKNVGVGADKIIEIGDFVDKSGREVIGNLGVIGTSITGTLDILEFLAGMKTATPETIAKFAKDMFGLGKDLIENRDAIKALVKAKGKLGDVKTRWFEELTGFEKNWKVSSYGAMSAHQSFLTRFGRDWLKITKSELKGFTGAKGVGKAIVKWAGVALSAVVNAFSNFEEFKDENGNVSNWTRLVSETILETAIDVAVGIAISAAVGAVLAAAGVAAAPVVLVAAIAGILTLSINVLSEKLTGKNFSEFISDAVLDSIEWVGRKIGEAADAVKDFWCRLTNAKSKQGEVDAIWAQANDSISQAILETQHTVDGVVGGMPTAGAGILSWQGLAVAGTNCIMPYGQALALESAGADYSGVRNADTFSQLITGLSTGKQQTLTTFIKGLTDGEGNRELIEFTKYLYSKVVGQPAVSVSSSVKIMPQRKNELFVSGAVSIGCENEAVMKRIIENFEFAPLIIVESKIRELFGQVHPMNGIFTSFYSNIEAHWNGFLDWVTLWDRKGEAERRERRYKDIINERLENANKLASDIYKKYSEMIEIDLYFTGGPHYSPSNGTISLNIRDDLNNPRGNTVTYWHETGHFIDHQGGSDGRFASENGVFGELLRSDFDAYVQRFMQEKGITDINVAYAKIGRILTSSRDNELSDLAGGLTGNRARGNYGHETVYWDDTGALEREAFAHFFEVLIINDSAEIDKIKEFFPNAFKEFEGILEGIA